MSRTHQGILIIAILLFYSVDTKDNSFSNTVFPYSEQKNIYTEKLMLFTIDHPECLEIASDEIINKFRNNSSLRGVGIYRRIRVFLINKKAISYMSGIENINPKSGLFPMLVGEIEDNTSTNCFFKYFDINNTGFGVDKKLPSELIRKFDNELLNNTISFIIFEGIWYIYEGKGYYSPIRIGENMEHRGIFSYSGIKQSIHYVFVKELDREKSIIDNLGSRRKEKKYFDKDRLEKLRIEFISRRSLLNIIEKEEDEKYDMFSRQVVILRDKIENDIKLELSKYKNPNESINCNNCNDIFKCPKCNIEIFPSNNEIEFNSMVFLQQRGYWQEDIQTINAVIQNNRPFIEKMNFEIYNRNCLNKNNSSAKNISFEGYSEFDFIENEELSEKSSSVTKYGESLNTKENFVKPKINLSSLSENSMLNIDKAVSISPEISKKLNDNEMTSLDLSKISGSDLEKSSLNSEKSVPIKKQTEFSNKLKNTAEVSLSSEEKFSEFSKPLTKIKSKTKLLDHSKKTKKKSIEPTISVEKSIISEELSKPSNIMADKSNTFMNSDKLSQVELSESESKPVKKTKDNKIMPSERSKKSKFLSKKSYKQRKDDFKQNSLTNIIQSSEESTSMVSDQSSTEISKYKSNKKFKKIEVLNKDISNLQEEPTKLHNSSTENSLKNKIFEFEESVLEKSRSSKKLSKTRTKRENQKTKILPIYDSKIHNSRSKNKFSRLNNSSKKTSLKTNDISEEKLISEKNLPIKLFGSKLKKNSKKIELSNNELNNSDFSTFESELNKPKNYSGEKSLISEIKTREKLLKKDNFLTEFSNSESLKKSKDNKILVENKSKTSKYKSREKSKNLSNYFIDKSPKNEVSSKEKLLNNDISQFESSKFKSKRRPKKIKTSSKNSSKKSKLKSIKKSGKPSYDSSKASVISNVSSKENSGIEKTESFVKSLKPRFKNSKKVENSFADNSKKYKSQLIKQLVNSIQSSVHKEGSNELLDELVDQTEISPSIRNEYMSELSNSDSINKSNQNNILPLKTSNKLKIEKTNGIKIPIEESIKTEKLSESKNQKTENLEINRDEKVKESSLEELKSVSYSNLESDYLVPVLKISFVEQNEGLKNKIKNKLHDNINKIMPLYFHNNNIKDINEELFWNANKSNLAEYNDEFFSNYIQSLEFNNYSGSGTDSKDKINHKDQ